MHAVGRDGHMMAGHIAGGTHHAFYDYGEGFCVFSGNGANPPGAPECFTDTFTGDFVRALGSNLDEDNAQMSLFRKIVDVPEQFSRPGFGHSTVQFN